MPLTSQRTKLNPAQRAKLKVLLREAEARGLPVAEYIREQFQKSSRPWLTDSKGYFPRFDGKLFNPYDAQQGFLLSQARFSLFIGGRGSGKAIDISTPIPTPNGWKLMKDVEVGDKVFDDAGNSVDVTWISDIMYDHICYQVFFSDESYIIADEEHLWTVLDAKARKSLNRRNKSRKYPPGVSRQDNYPQCQPKYDYSTITTKNIKENLVQGKRDDINYSVDCCKPLICEEKDLLIPPYLLGVWLGDGSSNSADVTIGKGSEEILEFLQSDGYIIRKRKDIDQFGIDFVLNSHPQDNKTGRFMRDENSFHARLSKLNLLGNKHIPQIYLRSSYEQRLELLCGLMDTDGYSAGDGRCEFCSTDITLSNDFYELLVSLGYKIVKKAGIVHLNGKPFIRFRFSFVTHDKIFRMKRKLEKIIPKGNQYNRTKRRYITNVSFVPSVPVKCIQVNSSNHLYLAGKAMIPTHNSCCGAQKSLQKIMQGFSGAVLNPTFENFKDSTWPEFRNWIPWDYVVPKHRYRAELSWEPQKPFKIVFENGAVVICKGLHDPDSARGPNINWLWFDEGQDDETGDAWNIATASVRVGKNPQAWVTATGRGTYHWMYDFFVEQKFPEAVWEELKKIQEKEGTNRTFIEWFHGSIYDNQDNLDPGFMASILANYPSGFKHDQEVLGLFADPGGNRGDASWFKDRVLNDPPTSVKNRVRYYDLAATEKKVAGKKITDPDETVGTKLSWWIDGETDQYCIEHQISGTWEWETIKKKIIDTARDDGPFVPIYIEEEPGSGGINQVAQIKLDIAKELPGWTVRGHKPEGDKVVRADIWFADATLKKFWLVKGEWNDGFLKQLSSFPNARHDDKVDSVSGARVCCAPIRKWSRMKFIHLNMTDEELSKATNLPIENKEETANNIVL